MEYGTAAVQIATKAFTALQPLKKAHSGSN